MDMRIRNSGSGLVSLLMAAVMVGCGGGGGSDTVATSSASSEGPISGFGSVIMNGVRWNTDAAAFEVDGRAGSQDDLDVGMVVRIEGRRRGDGGAVADRVVFESRLRGPIQSITELGPDNRLLEIFGLRALVSRADTRFRGTTLDDLMVGGMVELSGLTNAEGELEATHLRDRGVPTVGVTEVKVFGEIEGLAGGSFVIGTSEIFFDGDTLVDDFGPQGLRDGIDVRVEGILLANDAIDAREIESPRGGVRDEDFDEVELQGIVSDFVSIASFRVADRPVDASGALLIPNDPDLLRNGIRVEAEGRVDAGGILVAEKLKFRSNRVRIEAEVANDMDVDPMAGELLLLGIPIQLDGQTRVRDQRDGLEPFGLDDVMAGDFLEIRGIARADGTVTATRLERGDPDDLRLEGPVDMLDPDAGMFTILSVAVETGSSTRFATDDGMLLSAGQFFDLVMAGDVVEVKDREDGDETEIDFADEVELEEPDDEDDDDLEEDGEEDGDDDPEDGSMDD